MSTIPYDVAQAASAQCDLCGITPYSTLRVYAENVAAFAILAERTRCADALKAKAKAVLGDAQPGAEEGRRMVSFAASVLLTVAENEIERGTAG